MHDRKHKKQRYSFKAAGEDCNGAGRRAAKPTAASSTSENLGIHVYQSGSGADSVPMHEQIPDSSIMQPPYNVGW
jgi:hypothetical protein